MHTRGGSLRPLAVLVRLAAQGRLLDDVDSLATALEHAGWVRAVQGGRWVFPEDAGWDLWASGFPLRASFSSRGPEESVFPRAQALVRLLESVGLRRQGVDPGWVGWPQEPTSPPEQFGSHTEWVLWHGSSATFSLNAQPAMKKAGSLAYLEFMVERADAIAEEPSVGAARARWIARAGSDVERWFLAGDRKLSAVLVNLLRRDSDRVVAAAAYARPNR